MGQRWREFLSWRCESCGSENLILERRDATVDKPATFERVCNSCQVLAPGVTIRPAGLTYRLTTRQNWHPGPS
jgi:hypothetical protein